MMDVWEALEEAIGALDVPADGDELIHGYALLDCFAAKLGIPLGAFDADSGWAFDGATSLVAWLRSRARMSPGDAVRTAKAARCVHAAPVTAAAWEQGELST